MSIVERALEKNRTTKVGGISRPERKAEADRSLVRTESAAAIASEQRILATAMTLDRDHCRDRRLLVEGDQDNDGAAVAAYRMLRTRLLHRARTSGWTTIAVTSAGPNDGKTLTALNLAFSMAREKSREIILLDMDMRNPSVCRTLGVQPVRQLRDYLERSSNTKDIFFSVGRENLYDRARLRAAVLATFRRVDRRSETRNGQSDRFDRFAAGARHRRCIGRRAQNRRVPGRRQRGPDESCGCAQGAGAAWRISHRRRRAESGGRYRPGL